MNRLTSLLCVASVALHAAAARGANEATAVHPVVAAFERFYAGERPSSAAAGRLLLTELSCTACHAPPAGEHLPPKGGPVLDGIGTRVSAEWIGQFLARPSAAKPGTTMPDVLAALDEPRRAAAVESLVHLLGSSTKAPWKAEKLPTFSSAGRGMVLFHEVGCVACHAPDPAYAPRGAPVATTTRPAAQTASIPLPDARRKYTLTSLTRFLRGPLEHRPGGRMPDLLLDPQEATDVAAYLLGWENMKTSEAPPLAPFRADAALAAKGLEAFNSFGCANCHRFAGARPAPPAKALADLHDLGAGCVATVPARGVPHFPLSDAQRAAVRSGVAAAAAPPAARVAQTMERLNCYACHERDGRGGPEAARERYFIGEADLADEGRFPPRLGGVGRKLTRGWLDQLLVGREGRLRPYLRTRMPAFGGEAVGPLAAWLAEADPVTTPPDPVTTPPDPRPPLAGGDVEAGRQLLGTDGLSCITCHALRGRDAIGIRALDIGWSADRLQPAWFKANLLDPAAMRPGTLMPAFWPGGRAANAQILGGDTDRQIASIWAYLRDDKAAPPDGYPPPRGEFELVATDRPVLLRCFMKQVGTHAIAVGFPAPQAVHVAFDAKAVRPALAWRGRFLDAYPAWFVRDQPPLDPLGDAVVALPPGMSLAALDRPGAPWPDAVGADAGYRFDGYRLDKAGVPTFLYRFGGVDVEDRLAPAAGDGGALVRTLVLRGRPATTLYVRPAGSNVVTVRVTKPAGVAPGAVSEVRFADGEARLTMEYRW